MSLKNGDNFVVGNLPSFEQLNRMKNAWRRADPRNNLSNPQPGMALSDSDNNKRWHTVMKQGVVDFIEILQGDIICANNAVVCANNEVVFAPKT